MVRLEKSASAAQAADFGDKAALERYRRAAMANVPPGAATVHVAEEHDMPLPVFHWRDYEFTIDYEFFGQSFRRSVLYVDLNAKEQLIVTCVAPRTDFDQIHDATGNLLRSWQVMPVKK